MQPLDTHGFSGSFDGFSGDLALLRADGRALPAPLTPDPDALLPTPLVATGPVVVRIPARTVQLVEDLSGYGS